MDDPLYHDLLGEPTRTARAVHQATQETLQALLDLMVQQHNYYLTTASNDFAQGMRLDVDIWIDHITTLLQHLPPPPQEMSPS